MIEKFISIKNVGRFESFGATGDISFRKVSIVFSENGRGKTTLANILRSLCFNDSSFIEERKTLGATEAPCIEVRLDSGSAKYEAGVWDRNYQNLLIFDSLFIDENVYSGLAVSHDHKKNLYRFIIGDEEVEKATRIVAIDGESRQKARELSTLEEQITRQLPPGMGVTPFIEIEEDSAIEGKILSKQEEVAELQDARNIDTSVELNELQLVDFDTDNLRNLLVKSLSDVSADTEAKTKQHIAKLLGEGGEDWLRKGVDFIRDDSCPFCAQSISGVDIIKIFRDFFDESYNTLKSEITNGIKEFEASLSPNRIVALQKVLLADQKLFDFWKKHIHVSLSAPDLGQVSEDLDTLRVAVLAVLRRKHGSPLDMLNVPHELTLALETYESSTKVVDRYNSEIKNVNALIKAKKEKVKAGDLAQAKNELHSLTLIEIRYELEMQKLCLSYQKATEEKKCLTWEKAKLKRELDESVRRTLEQYQNKINGYLENFGADFQIAETEQGYAGGRPSTVYSLLINDRQVELGDDTTPAGEPCFKNTLSDGDRRTLAFAFFLAKLDQDPNLLDKTVVFDDPVTSLDLHRKTHATNAILNIAQRTRQILVMSHDPHFCFKFFTLAGDIGVARKALKIIREGQRNSKIVEWDPAYETRSEYFKDCDKLIEFKNAGLCSDLVSLARRIRPVLEGNLRMRFPGYFAGSEWLGDFIRKIGDANASDLLGGMKAKLQELEEINNFSKKFHHQTNQNADSETTTDSELQSFVSRTIRFITGC